MHEILEADAVEQVGSSRQAGEIDTRGQSAGFDGGRANAADDLLEGGIGRIFDDHAGRAIRAAPDDGAVGGGVAAHYAAGHLRAQAFRSDCGGRNALGQHVTDARAEQRSAAGGDKTLDECAAVRLEDQLVGHGGSAGWR